MDQPINFHQITETIGSAGQPTEDQLRAIANQGYFWPMLRIIVVLYDEKLRNKWPNPAFPQ